MYWVISQSWRQEWDVARALGVASPLVTVYAADFLKKTEGNAREILERMINAEMLQNSVLSLVRAAFVGVPFDYPLDRPMHRNWNKYPSRLFKLP